jgi:hypothetical protein
VPLGLIVIFWLFAEEIATAAVVGPEMVVALVIETVVPVRVVVPVPCA